MKHLVEFILISGITILCILLFVLYKSPRKNLSDKLLSIFFLSILCFFLFVYGDINDFGILQLITIPIADSIEFIIAPVLLFYVNSIVKQKNKLYKRDFLHFIPLILNFTIVTLPLIIFSIKEQPFPKYLNSIDNKDDIINGPIMFYMSIYVFYAIRIFNKYEHQYKHHYSNLDFKNINWLKYMLYGTLLISFLDCCFSTVNVFLDNDGFYTDIVIIFLIFCFIVYLGYHATNSRNIQLQTAALEQKHEAFHLKPTQIIDLKKDLKKAFKEDRIHLDESINLKTLAACLDISQKKLSYFLNHHLQTSFKDLINQERINEFTQKLTEDTYRHYTIIEIAYECGFSSKATFNRIFKQQTGMSPSDYKKSLKIGIKSSFDTMKPIKTS